MSEEKIKKKSRKSTFIFKIDNTVGLVIYVNTKPSANSTISGGNTSGTPPTFVDTTNRPADAASSIAIFCQ